MLTTCAWQGAAPKCPPMATAAYLSRMSPSSLLKYAQPLLFAAVFAWACAPAAADPVGLASEVRKTDTFHGIDIVGTMTVEARIDATTRVEVFGEADRLKQVITTVKDGVLLIDTKGNLKNSRLRMVVTAPSLDVFRVSGTGELRASGLDSRAIDVNVAGTANVKLAGKAAALRVRIEGTGEVRANDLIAADTMVDVRGTGNVKVHASRSIDARIAGTGSIKVLGRPQTVTKKVTGTGSIKLD